MTAKTVIIPDIGGANDVDVVEVCVAVGDTVNEGDSLVVLETDKASMEVPSPESGVVVSLSLKEGDTCSEGDAVIELDCTAGSASVEAVAVVEIEESVPASAASQEVAETVEAVIAPDLGGASDVDVIEVCVKPGDVVAEGDSLIVLETDKASMEVPAPKSGVVKAVAIKEGNTINEGDLILELTLSEAAALVPQPVEPSDKSPALVGAAAVEAPVASVAAGGVEIVMVPDLGGAADVDVIEVCVKVGDKIGEGDSLIVLETDKASMEVPAPKGGVVKSIKVVEGGSVNVGDAIIELEVVGAVAASVPEQPAASALSAAQPSLVATKAPAPVAVDLEVLEKSNKRVHAGPAVRMLARELGVDLNKVTGAGPKSRILKEDVQAFVKRSLAQVEKGPVVTAPMQGSGIPTIPEIDFSQFGEIELEKMSKIKRVTAQNMTRSWLNVPHVTQFDDVDITELEHFRKEMKADAEKAGAKLTPLPFLLKACAAALRAHPNFNVSLHADGQHIVRKQYVHIGVAMDTPAGLVVPVIRDVDKKSIYELAREIGEMGGKAKARKLKPDEMQGGCFTISSLGGIGGTGFTPIVNAPEVAILGVSRADIKPSWNGSEFVPRKMLPLALSYDHRAINGADAGRFMTMLGGLLSDIRRMVL